MKNGYCEETRKTAMNKFSYRKKNQKRKSVFQGREEGKGSLTFSEK